MTKRMFDIAASFLGLLFLSPAVAVVAILVRRESPGPAIFRQVRVGRRGKTFRIHKFRTMVNNADRVGTQITVSDDHRVTQLGATLRKYKIDEIPQLVDVLVGDMSMVGPRPEVPRYVALWTPAAREIVLSVRPGITDPAAIEFFDEAAKISQYADPERAYVDEVIPRKLALYESYVRDRSLVGDIKIIMRTLLRTMGHVSGS